MRTNLMKWGTALALALSAFSVEAGQTSYYIYDESGHVIGEYDANGNPIQEHVYLGDKPVAVVTNGQVDSVITDQLDTPRAVTDSTQAVVWQWNSDPYGNGQPTGSLSYNLRFPGQYYDAETGHSYNGFRDYDSETGRYLESDLIGIRGGVNTYTYVLGNPLRFVDPRGLDFPCPTGIPSDCWGNAAKQPPMSPTSKCKWKCNIGLVPACTAAAVSAALLTSEVAFWPGAIVGGMCTLVKGVACHYYCTPIPCNSN